VHRSVLFAFLAVGSAYGQSDVEPVHHDVVNRIRHEGFNNSEVMRTARTLTETIGPRLTGSPQMKRANEWTRDQMTEWGLENAHLESWPRRHPGWSFTRASAHVVAPLPSPLLVLPKAWTSGTDGEVRGPAVHVTFDSLEDLEAHKGTLAGKIVLISEPRAFEEIEVVHRRHSDGAMESYREFPMPSEEDAAASFRERRMKRFKMRDAVNQFWVDEKVLATVEISSRDNGILRITGSAPIGSQGPAAIAGVALAAEHYNRIVRWLADEREVMLALDVSARFHDDDPNAYNTVAELPGSDLADEVVMIGAHLDSWHGGSGATDNASGSSVMMEAMRILNAIDAKPRRTIRMALWSGEEQGLRGSRAYVAQHFAARPEPTDPEQMILPEGLREPTGPLQPKPAHEKFAAYFNMDNGSGRIRGIWSQGNVAVRPIFEAWLAPFVDLGATTIVGPRSVGGTDHLSYNAVGLPGFQFIQDRLDYQTQTHHTNIDVYDHLRREDLMQASVIIASFAYHAAMRDEKLPRNPMPPDPEPTEKPTENP